MKICTSFGLLTIEKNILISNLTEHKISSNEGNSIQFVDNEIVMNYLFRRSDWE